jgi:hypothetical protein
MEANHPLGIFDVPVQTNGLVHCGLPYYFDFNSQPYLDCSFKSCDFD